MDASKILNREIHGFAWNGVVLVPTWKLYHNPSLIDYAADIVGSFICFRWGAPARYAVGEILAYRPERTEYKFDVSYEDGIYKQDLVKEWHNKGNPKERDLPGAWCVLRIGSNADRICYEHFNGSRCSCSGIYVTEWADPDRIRRPSVIEVEEEQAVQG